MIISSTLGLHSLRLLKQLCSTEPFKLMKIIYAILKDSPENLKFNILYYTLLVDVIVNLALYVNVVDKECELAYLDMFYELCAVLQSKNMYAFIQSRVCLFLVVLFIIIFIYNLFIFIYLYINIIFNMYITMHNYV